MDSSPVPCRRDDLLVHVTSLPSPSGEELHIRDENQCIHAKNNTNLSMCRVIVSLSGMQSGMKIPH